MKYNINTTVRYIDNEEECDYPVGTIGIIKEVDYDSECEDNWTIKILFNGREEPTWHYPWEVESIPIRVSRTKELPCQS